MEKEDTARTKAAGYRPSEERTSGPQISPRSRGGASNADDPHRSVTDVSMDLISTDHANSLTDSTDDRGGGTSRGCGGKGSGVMESARLAAIDARRTNPDMVREALLRMFHITQAFGVDCDGYNCEDAPEAQHRERVEAVGDLFVSLERVAALLGGDRTRTLSRAMHCVDALSWRECDCESEEAYENALVATAKAYANDRASVRKSIVAMH